MIMKWLIRLSFPALGLLLLLIFFGINDPQEVAAPVTQDDPQTDEIPAFEGLVPSPVPTDGPDIVFKWQDTEGNWHYADQPPSQGPWNTLAIERPEKSLGGSPPSDPDTDWQSPYSAPFSMGPNAGRNGS
ncbi:hypothetical protein MSNKSG1_16986 [Marinobacter santoriniensis NKSG1]|uniref:DUF4124 domain-containing protein n=1 Tax=Marinobacter santoriniensis NKSG1 TaxID=1288826 RepID=M7CKB1_9GAMM|nr:hypothetical protein [Marinobacter santoriniensis]EMP54101.1 hypothetical protein MSNKSG1_16986 [Marinobacter santoriniensis NKSG1]